MLYTRLSLDEKISAISLVESCAIFGVFHILHVKIRDRVLFKGPGKRAYHQNKNVRNVKIKTKDFLQWWNNKDTTEWTSRKTSSRYSKNVLYKGKLAGCQTKTKQSNCAVKREECHRVWLCIINFPKKSTNITQRYLKVKLINTHKINKSCIFFFFCKKSILQHQLFLSNYSTVQTRRTSLIFPPACKTKWFVYVFICKGMRKMSRRSKIRSNIRKFFHSNNSSVCVV